MEETISGRLSRKKKRKTKKRRQKERGGCSRRKLPLVGDQLDEKTKHIKTYGLRIQSPPPSPILWPPPPAAHLYFHCACVYLAVNGPITYRYCVRWGEYMEKREEETRNKKKASYRYRYKVLQPTPIDSNKVEPSGGNLEKLQKKRRGNEKAKEAKSGYTRLDPSGDGNGPWDMGPDQEAGPDTKLIRHTTQR